MTVVVYPEQRIELLYGAEVLPFKVFDPARPVAPPVDDKTLNTRVDEVLKQRRKPEAFRPAADHPWRRPFLSPSSGAGQLAST